MTMREFASPANFLANGDGHILFPNVKNPLFYFRTRVDSATSLANRFAPGTNGTLIGTPTYTSDSIALSGNGSTPKGIDTGIAPVGDILMFGLVSKATSSGGICSATGMGTGGTSIVGFECSPSVVGFKNGNTSTYANVAWPGTIGSNYLFIAGWGAAGDFPRFVYGQAGALSQMISGTAFGVPRAGAANFQMARTGGGSGNFNAKLFAAFARAGQDDAILAEILAVYKEVQLQFTNVF